MRSSLYWTVLCMVLATLGMLVARGDQDRVPPSLPLSQFPAAIDGMTSVDIPIAQDSLDLLGKGIFLSRAYLPPGPVSVAAPLGVNLFIAYFPTQRSGQSIHSPQNCLPGSGWTFQSSGRLTIQRANGVPQEVGDYLVSDGTHQLEVLYWYKTESRWIANDWVAKGYMLLDSMRYGRTDAALIRVTTALSPGESREVARQRAVHFAQAVAPSLSAYIPD